MDPSYQPFLDSTFFERIFISNTNLHPSAEPSIDLVTPGIGMVANLYSCYEPIFYRKNESEFQTKIDTDDQIGHGKTESENR